MDSLTCHERRTTNHRNAKRRRRNFAHVAYLDLDVSMGYTPEINMEHNNEGLQDDFPFQV